VAIAAVLLSHVTRIACPSVCKLLTRKSVANAKLVSTVPIFQQAIKRSQVKLTRHQKHEVNDAYLVYVIVTQFIVDA